jgi:hypothetical protein
MKLTTHIHRVPLRPLFTQSVWCFRRTLPYTFIVFSRVTDNEGCCHLFKTTFTLWAVVCLHYQAVVWWHACLVAFVCHGLGTLDLDVYTLMSFSYFTMFQN